MQFVDVFHKSDLPVLILTDYGFFNLILRSVVDFNSKDETAVQASVVSYSKLSRLRDKELDLQSDDFESAEGNPTADSTYNFTFTLSVFCRDAAEGKFTLKSYRCKTPT